MVDHGCLICGLTLSCEYISVSVGVMSAPWETNAMSYTPRSVWQEALQRLLVASF